MTAAASSLRVLLAEDHRINQRLAVMLLESAKHRVDIAENGEEAVAAVLKDDYDVVLMDVQMPVLDGVQATQKIRALPPPKGTIPIIALTAHAMAGAREEYLSAGMNDYLSKPLEPDALFAALGKVSAKNAGAQSTTGAVCAENIEAPAVIGKIFDPVRIGTLRRVLPEGGVTDFVGMFRDSLKTVADRTERLIVANEIDELMREAHGLVGTAGNVGAIRISHCARELEQACRSADATSIARAAAALRQAVPETQCELDRWLDAQYVDAPLTAVT